MSVHVQLTPEALLKLHKQQRNSTITSIIIALLVTLLLGLILLFVFLKPIETFTPEIISYRSPKVEEDAPMEKLMQRNVQQTTPSSASPSMATVIAVDSPSALAVPVPEEISLEPSLNFGSGDGFGNGFGDDFGDGSGGGFGSSTKISGAIAGHLYDFKKDSSGKADKNYNTQNFSHFTNPVRRLQRNRFRKSMLSKYYKSQRKLYLRYVAIAFGQNKAVEAPRVFGVEKEVKPSGWIAHYRGKIRAPKDGTFRFVGAGDDYLSVFINGKFKLVSSWHSIFKTVLVPGSGGDDLGYKFGTIEVRAGSWFNVRKGEEMEIGITVGEMPGGGMGFVLMIEEKGGTYKKRSSGQNILPVFSMGTLTTKDKEGIRSEFKGFPLELDNVPVFRSVD